MIRKLDLKRIGITSAVLLVLLGILLGLYLYARDDDTTVSDGMSVYETGTVTQILTDNCQTDQTAENAYRGEQSLLVKVTSGAYSGKTVMADNAVGILADYAPVEVGDSVVLHISTYADGSFKATVHSADREPMVFLILALFILVTVLVGGRTGAKSILGLVLTIVVLLCIYLPLLAKGWDPILTAFMLCTIICITCFVILGGCSKKVLCASAGTIAGMALALLFGILAQRLLRVDALQAEYADAIYNEKLTGTPFRIRGLIVAGVIISSLGAVMDVAMSISSAMSELKTVNKSLTTKELWTSGMNIGRDMVGTMTNTIILAILGSSLMLIVYIYSMNLSWHQFVSSSFLAVEVVSSIASAIGVILAVPLTALFSSIVYGRKKLQ